MDNFSDVVLVLCLICKAKLRQRARCGKALVCARNVNQINNETLQWYHRESSRDLLLELPDLVLVKEVWNIKRRRMLYVLPKYLEQLKSGLERCTLVVLEFLDILVLIHCFLVYVDVKQKPRNKVDFIDVHPVKLGQLVVYVVVVLIAHV